MVDLPLNLSDPIWCEERLDSYVKATIERALEENQARCCDSVEDRAVLTEAIAKALKARLDSCETALLNILALSHKVAIKDEESARIMVVLCREGLAAR